jgi:hypothetical protein
LGDSGAFTVINAGTCDITVTGYDGIGTLVTPSLPIVIPAGGFQTFQVIDMFDPGSAFFITTTPCGNSATYNWPT